MPITHKWNGTVLTITSDSGSTSMDLKGEKGDDGARGAQGIRGERGGGALINDNTISKDEVWSSSGLMDRFAESMSYQGNPITCNPLPNLPFDIITDIEVKQEGSGTPYPAGGGKNILPPCPQFEETVSGITITSNGEGKYTVKGTATSTISVLKYLKHTTKLGDKVVVHLMNNNVNTNSSISYYRPDGTQITWTSINAVNRIQDNPTLTNETVSVLGFYVAAGETVDITLTPMILTDETPTAFIHYENIRPIVGMDAVKLTRCGKNLIPFPYYIGGAGTTVEHNGLTYTVNVDGSIKVKGTASAGSYIRLCDTVDFGSVIGVNGTNGTYVCSGNTRYQEDNKCVLLYFSGGSVVDATYYPQIEVGTTASSYEAYKGNTYTMELGQTVYSGSVDWNRGVMVVEWEYHTINGGAQKEGTNFFRINANLPIANGYTDIISDTYKSVYSYGDVMTKNMTIANNGSGNALIHDSRFDNAADFNAELAERPVNAICKLAEPQEIQLTPQLIRALKGTNTLYTDADKMTVLGRVDTMATIQQLMDRVVALEAKVGGE